MTERNGRGAWLLIVRYRGGSIQNKEQQQKQTLDGRHFLFAVAAAAAPTPAAAAAAAKHRLITIVRVYCAEPQYHTPHHNKQLINKIYNNNNNK